MPIGRSDSSLRTLCFFALALANVFGAAHGSCQEQAGPLTATYMNGDLTVSIPHNSSYEGSGKLTVEILDPEDRTLGLAERSVEISKGPGVWKQTIVPAKFIPFEEILWLRLHYRLDWEESAIRSGKVPRIEGIESISEIIRRPVIHVLGQSKYLAGSQAAIRVIVSDARNNLVQNGAVKIDLLATGKEPRPLFSGSLNRRGTLEAGLHFSAGLTGKYEMRYRVNTPIGSTEFTQQVQVEQKASILLTTEKPIYQPGQSIHARALALDRGSYHAEASRRLTFELEDSRGNKVFRKATETDAFGIASAEFTLADEVNLGAYHLRALMGDPQAPANTAELTIQVERYVLPKFKVEIEFTQKDSKPRRDYRPGDHVTGTVRANYFFGKPVDHASVTMKASGMDVAVFEAASTSGKTDDDGVYRFDLKLPAYFAGRPLSQGAARALIEATVKDLADHAETRGESITISESPLLITAVPEGGTLIPNIVNDVFLLCSYPDGRPARAALTVNSPDDPDRSRERNQDQHLSTDDSGVAVLRINPGSGINSLRIAADDLHGNHVSTNVPVQTRSGADQVLLHTNRALFKAGDAIQLKVLSTRSQGSAYIDIVKSGQTILTRDVDLENGQADLTITATPEMAGTLDIDAYLFGSDAQPVADHRLVFVQPADELRIETAADAAVYRPGSEARIRFHVTNARGEGVSAAIGLQIVDEAVFALAEKQPGFAKVFFYLEQEAMKPRYEIHSLSMEGVVEPKTSSDFESKDLAARALFSATEMAAPARLDVEFGRSLPQERFAEYEQRYRDVFVQQVRQLAEKLSRQIPDHATDKDVVKTFATLVNGSQPRDGWNTTLQLEPEPWSRGRTHFFLVRSAGPDRLFKSSDDLTVFIQDTTGNIIEEFGQHSLLDLRIEHDRGPVTERAEATGTVTDQTGAIIPGATVTLRQFSTRDVRTTHSDQAGQFTFAGLAAGRWQIHVSATGFVALSQELSLQARDRAILSATLNVGAETETVTVVAATPVAMGRGVAGGMAFGNATGADMAVINRSPMKLTLPAPGPPLQGRNFAAMRAEPAPAAPHVRSYFPEALYINPEILTDGHGDAGISVPIADSITTWRMALLASTQTGALGTGTSSIKVFQDFFVDLDLPVTLTQGDRVTLPVAVYNYSGKAGEVNLKLQPDKWFSLDNDLAEKTVAVESGRVGGSQFTLSANRIGKFKLALTAHMREAQGRDDGDRDDIVVREIEVIPNGREQNLVYNGRLETAAHHDLQFPEASVPDASSVFVRLYPGPLSQVIEGMDSILRMPGGCFEQTSSSTYPNVLALDYMKRTKKLTPETHAKAEGYIANGYQRLLTFEVPGGGFSWFGQAPANKILTAYGLMEFNDMSKVSDVDPRLIDRTRDWLVRQQQTDGSWKPDTSFINEGATNRYNSDQLRITAYIAWSLVNTGYQGPAVENARRFIELKSATTTDSYTLAVIANFAAGYARDRDFTRRSMQALIDARTEKGDQVFWTADETGVYSTGQSAAIETTGLATQALLKWGQASEIARKALTFIFSTKQSSGDWGTTQATIMALRALLLASELNASDVRGTLSVLLDGQLVETLKLTEENNDLLHQFVFKVVDSQKPSSVELKFDGSGSLAYQVVGRFFTPWNEKPPAEALSINVTYDRTRLARNDIATASAVIRNNLFKSANMVMVDLGIPPGFDLLSEDLQTYLEKTVGEKSGRLEKFSLTATQAILYFNALSPGQSVTLSYRLRAKFPIRARTFQSRIYEYYDPQVSAIAQPMQLEVTEH